MNRGGADRGILLARFWAGLGVLLLVFGVTMGSANARQLERRGVQVAGGYLGSDTVSVHDCHRDVRTLLRTWVCTGDLIGADSPRTVELRSAGLLAGAVKVDVWAAPGAPVSDMVFVPEGTRADRSRWLPSDTLAISWLALIVLVPLLVVVGRAVLHSRHMHKGQHNPFDQMAQTWDADASRAARAEAVAASIRERVPAGGDWLDYGAGTGALGLALLGHADTVTLADSSSGMVQAARRNIERAGLAGRANAADLDLARPDSVLPRRFDSVVSLMALHHVAEPAVVLRRIADEALLPGGWLAACDLDAEDGGFHTGHGAAAAHNGFDREQLRGWLAAAGFTDISFSTPFVVSREGQDYPLFLVVARRPGDEATGPQSRPAAQEPAPSAASGPTGS